VGALLQDLRFGIRGLRKHPGLTLVAILSLGLGIGANTTVFTWMNAFVLRPLPAVPDFDQLVHVATRAPNGDGWSVSYLSLRDWRAATRSMDLAASSFDQFGMKGEGQGVERVWGGLVSGNYFDVLRLRPVIGRLLTPADEAQRSPVAVLGFAFWQQRFGGDSAVLGRPLTLNGQTLTVVGVAPPRFGGTTIGLRWDCFMPVTLVQLLGNRDNLDHRDWQWLDATGRLRPGFSRAQAQAELDGVVKRIAAETNDDDSRNGAIVKPVSDDGAASFLKPVFIALIGVTAVVLLIACANVANLLLARAIARRREIGIRLALGANRLRLIRQLMTESLGLGVLAGLVGMVVAFWARDLFSALIPPSPFPIALDLRVDGRVLLFAFAVTILTALAFGLVPALQSSDADLVGTLKDTIGGAPARRARMQSALVVGQVALALVTLICGGLFVRSLDAARRADLGVRGPEHTLLVTTDLRLAGIPDSARKATTLALLQRVRAVPGVEAASLTMSVPLGFGGYSSQGTEPEGYAKQPHESMAIVYDRVGSDFFRAMGVPIVRGRAFEDAEVESGRDVVIVNEQFAKHFWPGLEPLGRRVRTGGRDRVVVGVAKQGKYQSLTESPEAYMYLPEVGIAQFDLVVRSAGDPRALVPAVRAAVRATSADLPFLDVRTFAEHMQAAFFTEKLGASMLAGLGSIALLLCAIGIYGVMSYVVSQRTREIGVRVALGAARRDVLGLVVGRAMRLAGVGMVIGLVAAMGAAQLLRSQLVGIGPRDPLTFVVIGVTMALVAAVAAWLPARRASRVDPMVALRYE
jgi:predicted permease